MGETLGDLQQAIQARLDLDISNMSLSCGGIVLEGESSMPLARLGLMKYPPSQPPLINVGIRFQSQAKRKVFFLGKMGTGKSTLTNMLIGRDCVNTGVDGFSVTQKITAIQSDVHPGLTVLDAPGFGDLSLPHEVWLEDAIAGPEFQNLYACIFVIKATTKMKVVDDFMGLAIESVLSNLDPHRWLVIITRCGEVDGLLDDTEGPEKAKEIVADWFRKNEFPENLKQPTRIYRFEKVKEQIAAAEDGTYPVGRWIASQVGLNVTATHPIDSFNPMLVSSRDQEQMYRNIRSPAQRSQGDSAMMTNPNSVSLYEESKQPNISLQEESKQPNISHQEESKQPNIDNSTENLRVNNCSSQASLKLYFKRDKGVTVLFTSKKGVKGKRKAAKTLLTSLKVNLELDEQKKSCEMLYSGGSNKLTDLSREEAQEKLYRTIKGKNEDGGIFIASVHYTDRDQADSLLQRLEKKNCYVIEILLSDDVIAVKRQPFFVQTLIIQRMNEIPRRYLPFKLTTALTTENALTMDSQHKAIAILKKPWRYVVSCHGSPEMTNPQDMDFQDLHALAEQAYQDNLTDEQKQSLKKLKVTLYYTTAILDEAFDEDDTEIIREWIQGETRDICQVRNSARSNSDFALFQTFDFRDLDVFMNGITGVVKRRGVKNHEVQIKPKMQFDEVIKTILNHVYQRLIQKIEDYSFDARILSNHVDVLISACRGGVPTGAPGAKGLKTFELKTHRGEDYVYIGGEIPKANEKVFYKTHLCSLKFSVYVPRPDHINTYAGLIIYEDDDNVCTNYLAAEKKTLFKQRYNLYPGWCILMQTSGGKFEGDAPHPWMAWKLWGSKHEEVIQKAHLGGFAVRREIDGTGPLCLTFTSRFYNDAGVTKSKRRNLKNSDQNMAQKEAEMILGLFLLSFNSKAARLGQYQSYTVRQCCDIGNQYKSLISHKMQSKNKNEKTRAVYDIWKVCEEFESSQKASTRRPSQ